MITYQRNSASKNRFFVIQSTYGRIGRAAVLLTFVGLIIAIAPGIARAQNCDNLSPSGNTDSANINTCLSGVNHATLGTGQFYVSQPVAMATQKKRGNSTSLKMTWDDNALDA